MNPEQIPQTPHADAVAAQLQAAAKARNLAFGDAHRISQAAQNMNPSVVLAGLGAGLLGADVAQTGARPPMFEDAAMRLQQLGDVLQAALNEAEATRGRVLGVRTQEGPQAAGNPAQPAGLGDALLQTVSDLMGVAVRLHSVVSEIDARL